ncbi:HAD family hydrolase [Paenibacillus sedimenti]|uniref:HAD family hydrolase n=1 Tax=Paenibacillus sedimenti TaxID=2770274 RepID=A0A926KRM4_9BACL|nr:HAD family hydrolase [Paenibacillus sedimenti]MBD0380795.1 HAD family hydrolase [Paenibacillus sedimenti]
MNNINKIRGIMFDMDNTLLKSHIDFQSMKLEIAGFFMENGLLPETFPIAEHTASTIIEHVKLKGVSKKLYETAMKIAVDHEVRGMEGAGLEPGALGLLQALVKKYVLVIVTNNSFQAASQALQITGIKSNFDLIVGREQMQAMKPSPSGYLAAKQHFSSVKSDEWISVGDSWIDGRASMDAGIPFISYGRSGLLMEEKGIRTVAHINDLMQLLDYV